MSVEKIHQLYPSELSALLEQAAQKGATEALARLGLHDESAPQDIYALRDFIKVIRALRLSILNKIVSILLWVILTVIVTFAGVSILGLKIPGK
jgi:hypothetical protein